MKKLEGIMELENQDLDLVAGGDVCCRAWLVDSDGDGDFDLLIIDIDSCHEC
jgi:hypothetical protein